MKSKHGLKHFLFAGLLLAASGSVFAADVGVSISVGQPGFYGRIDIGDYPYPIPRLIYRSPIVVHPHPGIYYEPMYLRVPPGHAKNWKRYCSRYNACGHPAYFVQDNWYHNEYAPIYRERHRYGNDYYDRDDRYDRRDRNDYYDRNDGHHNRGHGNGKGKAGKGKD